MSERPEDPHVVIVSNRGPLSFSVADDGALVARRGGGGLVSALGPAVTGSGATWIAAAITDADRRAASEGVVEAAGFRLRSLVVDPDAYRAYYDVVSSGALWFIHHRLYDSARRPRFDRHWRQAWDAYREVNATFSRAVIDDAAEGAVVLVQDYHLSLLGAQLATKRPDLTTVHFHHTPFGGPDDVRMLPDDVAYELLHGLASSDVCGFQAARWAAAFEASCQEVLGRSCPTFVSPAAVDPGEITSVASSAPCADALAELDHQVGDRRLVVRVDRIELSKNLLRGFHAFDELLETRPEWRERVVFGAFVYPSREGLPEYLAYRQETEGLIRQINERWATPGWTPILYDPRDDFARSVAALRRFDVLLVNPVRDGLNLVAKEGPMVNDRDGVLVLSRESGAWAELGDAALGLNPFDVSATAAVLHQGLSMGADERRARARAVRDLARARTPDDWLADQLTAAASARGRH
ncbi:MAG TPA: trehalose-6-phosphate synthase [Acidimicrobiales bacterium]|nr:trehalose-6-phosphate synthase [Acidimicrobiales bacterium]